MTDSRLVERRGVTNFEWCILTGMSLMLAIIVAIQSERVRRLEARVIVLEDLWTAQPCSMHPIGDFVPNKEADNGKR